MSIPDLISVLLLEDQLKSQLSASQASRGHVLLRKNAVPPAISRSLENSELIFELACRISCLFSLLGLLARVSLCGRARDVAYRLGPCASLLV